MYGRFLRVTVVIVAALANMLVYAGRASASGSKITATISGSTLTVTGTSGKDDMSLRLRAGDPTTLEVVDNLHPGTVLSFDQSTFNAISVVAGLGNDVVTIDGSGGSFTTTHPTTIDGGDGNDTLRGGNGAETFIGGAGDDVVTGGFGNDVAFLGDGNDTFVWNPGDGSDTIEGQAGVDTMDFNGANIAEKIDMSANGTRLRFTRDVANITMDTDGIENVLFDARGGADEVTVNDLAGTAVTNVGVDLAATPGAGTGDGAPDTVIVNGSTGNDTLGVTGGPDFADVTGVGAAVHIVGAEVANDALQVNALAGQDAITADPAAGTTMRVGIDGGADADTVTTNGTAHADTFSVMGNVVNVIVANGAGQFFTSVSENVRVNGEGGNDTITAGNGLATLTNLTIDGGPGKDVLTGGDGPDLIIGGTGSDVVTGGRGNDVALLGTGNDTFVWNPGDGSDTVEGQAGNDTLLFNGANISEKIDMSANGTRLRLTRDVASITMDTDGVENVRFNARAGADEVTVHDLTGTAVRNVAVDLEGVVGSGTGDGAADSVVVNGTDGNDSIAVKGHDGTAKVTGLVPAVTITGAEFANDRLDINTGLGTDVVHNHLAPNTIVLFVNGLPA